AGRFQHDIDAQGAPWQRTRVPLSECLDGLAAHRDAVVGDVHVLRQPAQHAVVLEQMRHGGDISAVVERHHIDVVPARLHGAPEVPPDTAESVDPYTNRHDSLSLSLATPHWLLDQHDWTLIRCAPPYRPVPTPQSPREGEPRGCSSAKDASVKRRAC